VIKSWLVIEKTRIKKRKQITTTIPNQESSLQVAQNSPVSAGVVLSPLFLRLGSHLLTSRSSMMKEEV